jgi:hypothetical protein
VVVTLPERATVLDAALAIVLTAHSDEVAEVLAASAAAELLADLAATGIGGAGEAPA